VKEIARCLALARRWREDPGRAGFFGVTAEKMAQRYEDRAAELLAEGLRRWAGRHPRTKYSLKSYHKLHATGTGSGGHNQKQKPVRPKKGRAVGSKNRDAGRASKGRANP